MPVEGSQRGAGQRPRGNEYRTTVVCVDSYEKSVLAGRFYNPGCGGGQPFESLMQLLVRMEHMLDEMRQPQSFTAARTFGAPPPEPAGEPLPDALGQEGKLATFAVRIIFRQNATWQGSVSWLEGGKEENFRSVLELVLLMDSALRGK